MRIMTLAVVLAACGAVEARAQEQNKPALEGAREVLYLNDLANPDRWSPTDCMVAQSAEPKVAGRPTLCLHMDVGASNGEEGGPSGRPRISLALQKPGETAWAEYETLEFMLMARMSRAVAPKDVLMFRVSCPDRSHTYNHNFPNIKLGEWIPVTIPVADIPNIQELAGIAFSVPEGNYASGDKVDFYISSFRLARSTELGLRRLVVKTPVVYQGVGKLEVDMDVLGPKAKAAAGLPIAVCQGGKVIRRETLPVVPARQTRFIDLRELKLQPGNYALVAFEDDPARKISGDFRVVESPWPTAADK